MLQNKKILFELWTLKIKFLTQFLYNTHCVLLGHSSRTGCYGFPHRGSGRDTSRTQFPVLLLLRSGAEPNPALPTDLPGGSALH